MDNILSLTACLATPLLARKELRDLKGIVFVFKRTLFGEEEGGL